MGNLYVTLCTSITKRTEMEINVPSATALNRRRIASRISFAVATAALMKELNDIGDLHHEIDAFYAPAECHDLVRQFDPDAVLKQLGRSMKWWRREARRRGLSHKWCYQNGLPYPA